MLCGQAVVAIWNGIADAGRTDFYEWHVREHMPERVGIPGFRRGRRYRAVDRATHPEFFTLYEVDTFEVLLGQDYANRLNAPTPWTKRATAHFRDTSRGLARVLASVGPGPGGSLATIRFHAADATGTLDQVLIHLMSEIASLPLVTGAHFCRADATASEVKTAESKGRTDIQVPPNCFVLIEACIFQALEQPVRLVQTTTGLGGVEIGHYLHEYTRSKVDWSSG